MVIWAWSWCLCSVLLVYFVEFWSGGFQIAPHFWSPETGVLGLPYFLVPGMSPGEGWWCHHSWCFVHGPGRLKGIASVHDMSVVSSGTSRHRWCVSISNISCNLYCVRYRVPLHKFTQCPVLVCRNVRNLRNDRWGWGIVIFYIALIRGPPVSNTLQCRGNNKRPSRIVA